MQWSTIKCLNKLSQRWRAENLCHKFCPLLSMYSAGNKRQTVYCCELLWMSCIVVLFHGTALCCKRHCPPWFMLLQTESLMCFTTQWVMSKQLCWGHEVSMWCLAWHQSQCAGWGSSKTSQLATIYQDLFNISPLSRLILQIKPLAFFCKQLG